MNNSRFGYAGLSIFACLLGLIWPSSAPAGTFMMTNVTVHQTQSDSISISYAVSAQAKYVGALDPEDDQWTINSGLRVAGGTYKNGIGLNGGNIFAGKVLNLPQSLGGGARVFKCTSVNTNNAFNARGVVSISHGSGPEIDSLILLPQVLTCPQIPPPPPCECSFDSDCENLYGAPEFGTWDCRFCNCLLLNSPLVLHLPDYSSTSSGAQNWWKKGFCGEEAPTVCLDWRGDGNITCNAWTAPESEIAFVVALSDEDMLLLSNELYVSPEPWRHFFGNVTKGTEGNFPFAHGFEALAAHCGQDPETQSEINLTECGLSLHVWADRSADGNIDPDELLEFQDLGIESLGDVRKTGKKDRCGNTFPAESHATCSDHPGNGKCGTWLDVFFESR